MSQRTFPLISLLALAPGFTASRPARADYQPNTYTEPGTGSVLQYNLFVPSNYNPADTTTKYPLLVFLHAAGTAADLPRTLAADGMGWVGVVFGTPANQALYPSFFIIPISQTNDSGWGDPTVPMTEPEKFEGRLTMVVLKQVLAQYNIDATRLYITGPSMGGRGTWDILRRYPGIFAGAAPSNAPAETSDAPLYVDQNIWSICGQDDPIAQQNTDIITAIRAAGGNPIYTLKANDGHDTWRTVYPDPQFMAWMYAQRLGVPWWKDSTAPTYPWLVSPDVVPPPGFDGGGFATVLLDGSVLGGSSGAGVDGSSGSGSDEGGAGPGATPGMSGQVGQEASDAHAGDAEGGAGSSGGATSGSSSSSGAGPGPGANAGSPPAGSAIPGAGGAPAVTPGAGTSAGSSASGAPQGAPSDMATDTGGSAGGKSSGGCNQASGQATASPFAGALALLGLFAYRNRRANRRMVRT